MDTGLISRIPKYGRPLKDIIYILACLILLSCDDGSGAEIDYDYQKLVPTGFPTPVLDSFPSYNQVKLGRKLFFDPVLSADNTISCATCHNPSLAFTDTLSVSIGIKGRLGFRNSISLANVVYQTRLLREGGLPTLEMQVLVPIQEHAEFDNNILRIAEKLNRIQEYVSMSVDAYGRVPDAYVITRSLAAFQRTIFSGDSRYDRFLRGEINLTEEEMRGMSLFNGQKAGCASCHSGFLFTNQGYENNGLFEEYETDPGRKRLTGTDQDEGRFKVPSLRNVGLTYPYMHDGSLRTLEEVVDFYNRGGSGHRNKNPIVRPLFLSEDEKQSLVVFLHSLSDHTFNKNPLYNP